MKRYLADTHAVLWLAARDLRRLGRVGHRALLGAASGRTEIAVSVVSLWEIALLHDAGTIRFAAGFTAWCDALESVAGFRVEPLTRGDVEHGRSLAVLADPHDRLIGGAALRLGVELLTRDQRLRSEKRLRTVW